MAAVWICCDSMQQAICVYARPYGLIRVMVDNYRYRQIRPYRAQNI